MEVLLAAAVGAAVGWVMGRRGSAPSRPGADAATPTPRRKLNKRQREILATLPPDPPPRTIEDLMAEEAVETGVDLIPDAGLPLPLRLRVWHRDRPQLPDLPSMRFRFDLADGTDAGVATDEQIRLVVVDDDTGHPTGGPR